MIRRAFRARPLSLVLPILLLGSAAPPRLAAQESGWDGERARGIVEQAVESRRSGRDNDLERYTAYAEGRVHYLAEYGEGIRDQAVRSDRIALQMRWRRGVGSLQTIVGRRHVSWVPTTVRYHVDHLSLVVENFGDRIHIGDGDEVRDVLHPVAPGAPGFYEYRLADSLQILVNGRLTELYRLDVRPRRSDSPGVVGSIDVERESYALVRMAVSFTPASYVDPTVSGVTVDLQNALVANRVWLPARQHTEVRRQMRFLDLPFGGTIRTSFEVLSWDLDPPKDEWVPVGHRVRQVDERELRLYAGWRTWEAHGAPEPLRADSALFEDIRAEATRVAAGRYLGGTARLRLDLPTLSSLLRVRRAEGLYAGLGARYDIDGLWSAAVHGGYAFGAAIPEFAGSLEGSIDAVRVGVGGWMDRPADVGPWTASSGLIASGGALFRGDDYVDPFFESGGGGWVSFPAFEGTARVSLDASRHESADLHLDPFGDVIPRPVRPAEEGWDGGLQAEWRRELASLAGSRQRVSLTARLAIGDFGYTRWVGEWTAAPTEPDAAWAWEGRAGIAATTGSPPVQQLVRLGGRGTIPGYEFRSFDGDVGAFFGTALSRSVIHPWFRVRVLGAIGWSHVEDDEIATGPADEVLSLEDSAGLRPALGGGVSIVYDLVRLEFARGLDGGTWEWMLSVNPEFRPPL